MITFTLFFLAYHEHDTFIGGYIMWNEILLKTFILSMIAFGYFLYWKNVRDEETGTFMVLPWINFSFLAYLDWENIRYSETVTPFENFSGFAMFIGPLSMSVAILIEGAKQHGGLKKIPFFLKQEYVDSKIEVIFLGVGLLILICLYILESHPISYLGDEYGVELSFAIMVSLLDFITVIGLIAGDVYKRPKYFDMRPWLIWSIIALFASWWSIQTGADNTAIGTLLIMESAIMSLLMLWAILYFRINAK
jgi:hypothetical protein